MPNSISNVSAGRKPAPFQVHSAADLEPYCDFPKIYNERKFQRPHSSSNGSSRGVARPNFRVRPSATSEFWHETGVARNDFRQRFRDARKFGRLIGRHQLPLGLLRTCKVIHDEASQVFYSKNEFRFSGINGCIVASAFLHTITQKNWQWLTSLTIAMPFRSRDRSIYANEANPWTWLRFSEVIRGSLRPGFRYPSNRTQTGREWWQYENVFALLAWKLTQMPDLMRLTLVLPHYFELRHTNEFKTWSALEDLIDAKHVQVVSLVSTDGDAIPNHHDNPLAGIGDIVDFDYQYFEHDSEGRWGLF